MFFDFVMLPTFLAGTAALPKSCALIIILHVSEVKGSDYDVLHANKQKSMNIIDPVSSSPSAQCNLTVGNLIFPFKVLGINSRNCYYICTVIQYIVYIVMFQIALLQSLSDHSQTIEGPRANQTQSRLSGKGLSSCATRASTRLVVHLVTHLVYMYVRLH